MDNKKDDSLLPSLLLLLGTPEAVEDAVDTVEVEEMCVKELRR